MSEPDPTEPMPEPSQEHASARLPYVNYGGSTWCAEHDEPIATFHCESCVRSLLAERDALRERVATLEKQIAELKTRSGASRALLNTMPPATADLNDFLPDTPERTEETTPRTGEG